MAVLPIAVLPESNLSSYPSVYRQNRHFLGKSKRYRNIWGDQIGPGRTNTRLGCVCAGAFSGCKFRQQTCRTQSRCEAVYTIWCIYRFPASDMDLSHKEQAQASSLCINWCFFRIPAKIRICHTGRAAGGPEEMSCLQFVCPSASLSVLEWSAASIFPYSVHCTSQSYRRI